VLGLRIIRGRIQGKQDLIMNYELCIVEQLSKSLIWGEALTTASGRDFVRAGVWSARRKSQWLFLSGKRAAALGNQSKGSKLHGFGTPGKRAGVLVFSGERAAALARSCDL